MRSPRLLKRALSCSVIVLGTGVSLARGAEESAVPVSVAPVVRTNLERRLEISASVRAWQDVVVAPEVPGHIAEIRVDMGDRVSEGQILARIDDRKARAVRDRLAAALKVAKAARAEAQARLKLAQVEKERVSNLLAEKSATQRDYDRAAAEYDAAKAAVELAEARVDEAARALQEAEERLADHVLTAPFAGRIAARFVDRGATVAPGTPVVRMVDDSRLRVLCDVPQVYAGVVVTGLTARLQTDAFPDREVAAVVGLVGPAVDSTSRTLPVQLFTDGRDRRGEICLRPGMYVTASVLLGREEVLVVRREAILKIAGTGTPYVFVVREGHAEKRFVETGQESGNLVEIISGLKEGDQVIYRGQIGLRGGEPVQVRDISGGGEEQ